MVYIHRISYKNKVIYGHGFCACGRYPGILQYPFRTIGLADVSGAYPETALDTAVSSRSIPLSLSDLLLCSFSPLYIDLLQGATSPM